jgi:hypothetical protein
METAKDTTPVIQVSSRPPRQDAIQNLPHRCTTMNRKKNSTLHRWVELTKCPNDDTCHQLGPLRLSTTPEAMITTSEAMAPIPKT